MSLDLESIARDYGRAVSSVCGRMIRDPEAAEDAAQEIWLEITKSLPSFRGDSKLSTWIYTIARRHVLAFARGERTYSMRFIRGYFHGEGGEPPVPPPNDAEKPAWVKRMCDKCLTGILHCLDVDTRLAYVLREVARVPYEQLARILGREAPSLRKTLSRVKHKLARFLKDECGLYNRNAPCRCRMRAWVEEVDLPSEYEKLRTIAARARLYRESERILPSRNYWEKILSKRSQITGASHT